MSLNFSLEEVKNYKDLYVDDGYMEVPVWQIGILDDGEHYWVSENGDYRAATETEVEAAREGKVDLYTRGYRLNSVTEALIWSSIPVGIPRITEENANEFFRRIQRIEEGGALMATADLGSLYFTWDDIVRHIGLRTNVAPVTKRTFDANWPSEER